MGNVGDFTVSLIRTVASRCNNGHIDTENDICFEYGMSSYFFFLFAFILNPVMREWTRGPRQLYFVPSLRKEFGQCMPALLCGRLHRLYYADVFSFSNLEYKIVIF